MRLENVVKKAHGKNPSMAADRYGTGFCAGVLPVGAATFLNRADLPPLRLLNALHDGGYLSFAFGSLRGRHYYPLTEIRLCRAFVALGLPEAAAAAGRVGLRRATLPAPGLLLNLASAFSALGHHELAAAAGTAARHAADRH